MSLFDASTAGNPAEIFSNLWEQGSPPPDIFRYLSELEEFPTTDCADVCLIDIKLRKKFGILIPVEEYLEKHPKFLKDEQLVVNLVAADLQARGRPTSMAEIELYISQSPRLRERLGPGVPNHQLRPEFESPKKSAVNQESATVLFKDQPGDVLTTGLMFGKGVSLTAAPDSIGRYRVLRLLGDGGFGRVFLAHDDELDRHVAIKVPRPSRVHRPEDIDAYLDEARIVAKLDHSAIVPVYDCGRTDDGFCFVVSKYIEGCDLANKLKRSPLTMSAAAQLAQTIAEALHYAHLRGVVHRDVKPANILLDLSERPYLADFGIALKEEDFGKKQDQVGTLPYMSPEQVRGEGHLVDGRSDVFSLGVMIYEMLTGKRPFPSNRFSQSLSVEARPPRQFDDAIPRELERICLKALSCRVVDRYNTALDLATDLRDYLTGGEELSNRRLLSTDSGDVASPRTSGHLAAENWVPIVPKGLRSFDRNDADFFLELLPGTRARGGIPESVNFWISRIEELDPDQTFRVGLIYGPSGSGKSSFIKAGVLPRLSQDVIAHYIECTPVGTTDQILRAIRKSCPELPPELGLVDSLTMIRRGQVLGHHRKMLLVLDQFEQWLHAHESEHMGELLRGLRQCDGEHLQCILGVRDDFWMAVTHFMDELEMPFVRGENVAAIDLFNIQHAKKVLIAIGQGYQSLPSNYSDLHREEKDFISTAVAELSDGERVVPVHLALFAEMVKNKPWNMTTLRSIGGIAGVGVTFLEESFNGRTASPALRLHSRAARNILKSLLSEQSSTIKGAMRSHAELLDASGYADRPKDFETVIKILDFELRLITPTDPEGSGIEEKLHVRQRHGSERFYHLTHDYLVPSLHDWLTSKQRETRRGRAELLLEERGQHWAANPVTRSLPTFLEWLGILACVPWRVIARKQDQRRTMSAATRYYLQWMLLGTLSSAVMIWGIREQMHRSQAQALVNSLARSSTQDVPRIAREIVPLRYWADPLLRKLALDGDPDSPQAALHAAMSLPLDPTRTELLVESLLTSPAHSFASIRDVLQSSQTNRKAMMDKIRQELQAKTVDSSRRFRAGVALVGLEPPKLDSPDPLWMEQRAFLSEHLLEEINNNPDDLSPWIDALRPLRTLLYPPLLEIYQNSGRSDLDRSNSAQILSRFCGNEPRQLVELALTAEPYQYVIVRSALMASGDLARDELLANYHHPFSDSGSFETRVQERKRHAYAAVALLDFQVNSPIHAILATTDDPDLTSHAENRLSRLAAHPELLIQMLEDQRVPIRGAAMRSLGGMKIGLIPKPLREPLFAAAARLFQSDTDSGIHSAAEWSLRSWGRTDLAKASLPDNISPESAGDRNWYVTKSGQTMAVFRGPIVVRLGSPVDQPYHESDETLVTRKINRDFAIATTEVTHEHFQKAIPDFRHKDPLVTVSPDCPAVMMTWYRAAEYCNWLSKQEGLPPEQWCYQSEPQFFEPFADFLSRTGYRLPTEAEWEYACRAGSTGLYSWGNDPSLSRYYCWTVTVSEGHNWPVGLLTPNRLGLFDMHGNVGEWITEKYTARSPEVDTEDAPEVAMRTEFDFKAVARGSASSSGVVQTRAANRTPTLSYSNVSSFLGFRVARTIRSR